VSIPEPHNNALRAWGPSDPAAGLKLSPWTLLVGIFPFILTAWMIISAMLAGSVTAPVRAPAQG
jgi:hypothetical protein